MKFFENTFFAVKLASIDKDVHYWEILRKIQTLPGAKGELLEVLAQCLYDGDENYFFFDVKDFDLCEEITELGGQRIGYLADVNKGDLIINGWGDSWTAQVKYIDEINLQSQLKKNLFQLSELKHSLDCTNDFFAETFFKRDRMYWGITKGDPKWLAKASLKQDSSGPFKIDKWNDLAKSRKSAEKFIGPSVELDQSEVHDFLSNSLYKRSDEHLHYGSAGGFSTISTSVAIRNVKGLQDGLYRIDADAGQLIFQKTIEHFDMLENFLFLTDELSKASLFLFFSIQLDEVTEKYGQRAIRFSLLTLGGALQQAHLAATALGISYRTIGGFDELQCGKFLGIEGREYLACAAVLGK